MWVSNLYKKQHTSIALRCSTGKLLVIVAVMVGFAGTSGADQIQLTDGTTIEVDEAWEDATGIWFRRGGITQSMERERVRLIDRRKSQTDTAANADAKQNEVTSAQPRAKAKIKVADSEAVNAQANTTRSETGQSIWIHLTGGARVEVDELTETADGVWYSRGTLSIFVDRARIERIERKATAVDVASSDDDNGPGNSRSRAQRAARGWTTGNRSIDALIRSKGARYNVDPYLIFCVMEQESHFNSRAVSPVGAKGLMQLMPGTAARFGVRQVFDPAENISGGTRYLKELLNRFGGRVDLVLASYNAGEGAVMKYGYRVPPYRETRNYVRRIVARYGQS